MTTSRTLLFACHVHPQGASGGAVYTQGLLDLFRAVYGAESVCAVHPPRSDARDPRFERLICMALGALRREPSKVVFSRRSGLGQAAFQAPEEYRAGPICLGSPDCSWVADQWTAPSAPRIVVCQNIEADLFDEQVAALPGIARWVVRDLLRDPARYRRWEEAAFRQARMIICISALDREVLQSRYPEKGVLDVPPVFASPHLRSRRSLSGGPLRLGFLGKMTWWPNRDALRWLVEEILHPMPESRELHLFGPGSEAWDAPGRRIFGHGFVPDLSQVWDGVDLMLCPVRHGGGVNVKLAEALHNRMPVVATPFSARGLPLPPGGASGLRFVGTTDAWRRFVASDEAETLAGERPPEALSNLFSQDLQVGRLRDALLRCGLL